MHMMRTWITGQLQEAAPVHLVQRLAFARDYGLPEFFRLFAALGSAVAMGGDHWRVNGRGDAGGWRPGQPAAARRAGVGRERSAALSICCMCWRCRRCYLFSSACITTRLSSMGTACRRRKRTSAKTAAKRVPLDKRVYFIPGYVDLRDVLAWRYDFYHHGAVHLVLSCAAGESRGSASDAAWHDRALVFLVDSRRAQAGRQVLLGRGLPDNRARWLGAAALSGCDPEPALCASALHADDRYAVDLRHDDS